MEPRAKEFYINMRLCAASIAVTLLVLECIFRFFYLPSDGYGISLAGRAWNEKYWHPINSFGYRDIEHPLAEFQHKKNILVVGDSFVTGHGIKDIADRFPDRLRSALGKPWNVVVVAQNGWDTADEYNALVSFPAAPQLVILSYFINDMDRVLDRSNIGLSYKIQEPTGIFAVSYLANFFYWRMYGIIDRSNDSYAERRTKGYNDTAILQQHEKGLQNIIDYTMQRNIPLIVVLFPQLNNVEGTAWITKTIAAYFQQQQVMTIDLATLLAGRSPADITVNPYDGHPNEQLHAEVAGMLYDAIIRICAGNQFRESCP